MRDVFSPFYRDTQNKNFIDRQFSTPPLINAVPGRKTPAIFYNRLLVFFSGSRPYQNRNFRHLPINSWTKTVSEMRDPSARVTLLFCQYQPLRFLFLAAY
ncbi:hypothetical protein TNCT_181351 [Trichonephila clavata]|uniref:Uncharacterized protein n=1 Tax=Trichonephila clavata TaxID=2740835 RepID=A0A8X6M5L0_TRICU|nr:hypothetical protein TNCT_181351 [Trichonephila clavata]